MVLWEAEVARSFIGVEVDVGDARAWLQQDAEKSASGVPYLAEALCAGRSLCSGVHRTVQSTIRLFARCGKTFFEPLSKRELRCLE